MADRVLYTDEAALNEAAVIQKNLADSAVSPPVVAHVRLFNDTIVPVQTTARSELEGAETTLVGYPTGGYPITDMANPIFAPGGGAVIQSPIIQVVYASGSAVAIGGYWVEDSDDGVREVFIYDPPRQLAIVGDGFPIVVQFGYGRNAP